MNLEDDDEVHKDLHGLYEMLLKMGIKKTTIVRRRVQKELEEKDDEVDEG